VRAQFENVRTLRALGEQMTLLPAGVRQGYAVRLRQARLNLGYALSKSGQRRAALRAVLPSLHESPGVASVRNVLSILKG
jgi:hypothetical protein